MNVDVNMASVLLAQNANDTAGLTVLKKAMNIEAQSVQTLLGSIPQPQQSSVSLPPNLGRYINTTA
jgi:predicted chitinase